MDFLAKKQEPWVKWWFLFLGDDLSRPADRECAFSIGDTPARRKHPAAFQFCKVGITGVRLL